MNFSKDVNITGGIVTADKDTTINAGGNVNMDAVKDLYSEESEVGHRGGSYYNHNKQADETVKGTNIAGKENITINSGADINMKGSNITSEAGKAVLNAENNVNIQNETEYHERLHESHEESSGILSSKSTDIYDYSNVNNVVGSNVSAGSVDINSGKDTNVKGSNIVADKDVNIKTGGQLNVESAEETSASEYQKTVKKSGLLSGGGLGFTIGKEKQKDQYANQNSEQVGSTIGSIKGSVNMEAEKDANIKGSNVIAKEDINITGSNVNIENSNSIYNAQEKHEYERSGLTVSVGGTAVEKVTEAVGHVERANQVEDKRLSALHGYEAYDTVKDNIKKIERAAKDPSKNISLNVSIGSTKSKSESESTTIVANGSNVKAEGNVGITSTQKDINIKGSNVSGDNVTLNAKENLNITASENTNKTEQNSKSSSASIGATIGVGGLQGINAGYSKSQGNIKENGTTYNESTVAANKDMEFTSGKDTSIKGGKVSGDKVTGNVGGDLNIESKQDNNSYKEENTSSGFGVEVNLNDKGKIAGSGITGGLNKGNIDSKYDSVTDQSGIYAGNGGFDINVEKNTDLKGGIIDSKAEADKNKISTGTLTYEDIKNKAAYEADSKGIAVDTTKDAETENAGVTPNIGMPAGDEAGSTTKSTVAEGEIEIRDKEKQKQDLAGLNRDTQNSLNKLGEIFDKDEVKEKQEFAGLFQKAAHSAIGDLTGKISRDEKAALNVFVDGLVAEWSNGNFLAGASGTALLESMQEALGKIKDPALKQIAAGILGAAAGEIVGGNAQAGASGAVNTEKYNHLTHEEQEKIAFRLDHAASQEERVAILRDALEQSSYNRLVDPDKAEVIEQYFMDELEKITKYDNNIGVSFKVNPDLGLHNNLIAAEKFFSEYEVVKHLPDVFSEGVKIGLTVTGGPISILGKAVEYGDTAYTLYTSADKYGMDIGKIVLDVGFETGKSYTFKLITKTGKEITNAGVVILSEAGFSVYLNDKYKDKFINSGDDFIDAIYDWGGRKRIFFLNILG